MKKANRGDKDLTGGDSENFKLRKGSEDQIRSGRVGMIRMKQQQQK